VADFFFSFFFRVFGASAFSSSDLVIFPPPSNKLFTLCCHDQVGCSRSSFSVGEPISSSSESVARPPSDLQMRTVQYPMQSPSTHTGSRARYCRDQHHQLLSLVVTVARSVCSNSRDSSYGLPINSSCRCARPYAQMHLCQSVRRARSSPCLDRRAARDRTGSRSSELITTPPF
jgi:hypothetical protein